METHTGCHLTRQGKNWEKALFQESPMWLPTFALQLSNPADCMDHVNGPPEGGSANRKPQCWIEARENVYIVYSQGSLPANCCFTVTSPLQSAFST